MAENYVLLETIELTQNAASIVFDNIPQSGYTDLKIVMSARSNYAATGSGAAMTFNGVSTGYSYRQIYGFSGGTGSVNGTSTGISFNITSANFTANSFESIEFYIPNYTASTNKSISIEAVRSDTASAWQLDMFAYLWSNSAAISSITIAENNSSTFVAGCTFSLYGIAALGTTPTFAPKASGGDIVANDGTYWYHAFLSSGTFTAQTELTCDVLQVAGGGGGGGNNGGGGGAGGLLIHTAQSLTAANYTVTVGAGGFGSNGNDTTGYNGGNSQFASLTAAVGGGGGGSYYSRNGANGGSGGGGGSYADAGSGGTQGIGGSGTAGQGFAGGNGQNASNPNHLGAGGGGAGGAGANGSGTSNGGIGSSTYSSWGLVTGTGQNSSGTYYYAGGGGGAKSNTTGGSGGLGGGGNGGAGTAQTNGMRGTGGGGGGQPNQGAGSSSAPASGGSGVVIIRYAMA